MLQYVLAGLPVGIAANDKPIGGSLLPFLFGSTALVLVLIGLSLYSLGYWEMSLDTTTKRGRIELVMLGVLVASGFLIFYTPLALFTFALAGFYFLITFIQ